MDWDLSDAIMSLYFTFYYSKLITLMYIASIYVNYIFPWRWDWNWRIRNNIYYKKIIK